MSALAVDLRLARQTAGGEPFTLAARFEGGPGVTVVYGPSGSGKTTLLLAIVGGLRPDRGRVAVADRVLFDSEGGIDVPVRARGVGIVFQDALLFPHLSAEDNVRFGLRDRSGPTASEWLERVGASALADRMPSELSGGQRQRVALARALAARPRLLLLDEPFSALDPGARGTLADVLDELQSELGVPFLHVTHDLGEALRLGERLVLLEGGAVVQTGAPAEVLARPASAAAARALGTENIWQGAIEEHHPADGMSVVDLGGTRVRTLLLEQPPGQRVTLGLRGEDVLISLAAVSGTSARNVLAGTVTAVDPRPAGAEVAVATPVPFRVRVTAAAVRELALAPGRRVHLLVKASAFHRVV